MSKRRGLQRKTAEVLSALQFMQVSGTRFTRRVGQQLHFVGLQYRTFGSEITFNLGCHFVGIPSLFDFRSVAVENLDDLDCGLRVRIGSYIEDGFYDVWWNPDNEQLPGALAQASWPIERAFEDCIKQWGDGTRILESHVRNRAGSIRLSKPLLRWMIPLRQFHRFAFLALVAHYHGDDALAATLFNKAIECDDRIPLHCAQLREVLGRPLQK